MSTIPRRLRALIDSVNKRQAKLPSTGGEGRNLDEALGTGAAARGVAMMRTKKNAPGSMMPLAELIAKMRVKSKTF